MGATSTAARPLPSPPLARQPGLLKRIFTDPAPALDELAAAHGPMVGLGAGPLRMAVVGDPEALRELFRTSTDSFQWGHAFNVLGFVVGDESMIVSDGDDHRRRRGAVQAAFSRRRLNGWIPMIVERIDAALDALVADLDGSERLVDLYPIGRRVVLEVVVRSLFGERLAARAEEIGDLFRRSQAYLESPGPRQFPHPFPFGRRAEVREDRRALDRIVADEIARIRRAPSGDPLDVLEALVVDGTLTDDEIQDQVVTLMGAGYDTTAASFSWLVWCTSLTDGLWARLRAEADAVFGPLEPSIAPEPPDDRTLAALDLANRTMRETTRLHPAGVISPRRAVVGIELGGYRIPKGTMVLWSAHLAGRDARAWADPLTFDPERFVDVDPERSALADLAWVPFGRGARNCVGFALAQMELTLLAARVAQRLDVRAPDGAVLPRPVGMVVNRPAGGAPVLVRART